MFKKRNSERAAPTKPANDDHATRGVQTMNETSVEAWCAAEDAMGARRPVPLPSSVVDAVREWVGDGLTTRLAMAEHAAHYVHVVRPLRCEYVTAQTTHDQKRRRIVAACAHAKERRREDGLYGETYWVCRYCHEEWR
jgi:hypothetical protein